MHVSPLQRGCACAPQQQPSFSGRLPLDPCRVGSRATDHRFVGCGSSQSSRFRLDFDPRKDPEFSDVGFTQNFQEAVQSRIGTTEDEDYSVTGEPAWDDRRTRINVANRHARRATMTPLHMHHQKPFSNEESFLVGLERNYSKDWPSVEFKDNKIVFRRGFLEPLEDPDAPYCFIYSGVERFAYTLPERTIQAIATSIFVAAYASAFAALFTWQPQFAAAALISWLTNSLSLTRWATILLLASTGTMWIFWAVAVGTLVDEQLARHAPSLRETAWFWFKAWLLFCFLTTAITPPLPFYPFKPNPTPFDYPFPIFRMK